MKNPTSLVIGLAAAALLYPASVSPSLAASTYFVSGAGNDGNICTLTQPCRSIGRASLVAGNGGAVSCLDAGPYTEAFSTTDSFTLDCRGVVSTNGPYAIAVLGTAVVTFRNVIFDGAPYGVGGYAVHIAGGKVVFENCTFQNWTASPGMAVHFVPTVAGAQLTITDSVFTNNGTGSGGGGIIIQPSGGVTASAVIERTQVTNNTYGIVANGSSGPALVEIRYSSVANNAIDGIWAYTGGSIASVVVEHSASVQNGGNGVYVQGANAYASLKDSTVDWNATGLRTGLGGTILSYGNNVIAGNTSAGVTPVSVGQQ